MKSIAAKTCPGSRIEFRHDSPDCLHCLRTNFFYNELQPALEKQKKDTDSVEVYGIISFLKYCLVQDEKIATLPDQHSNQDTFANSTLPDAQKSINYYNMLKDILYSKKDVNKFSCSVYTYTKYKNNPSNGAKTKQSDKKNKRNNIIKKTAGKKSKFIKMKPKKKISAKIPTKGSLKRKRWFFDKISKRNEEYADDIFEERPFYQLADLDEISSNSSDYSDVDTPKWSFSLSPRSQSPVQEYDDDCYSVAELRITRKEAEEYQHRRKNRRMKRSKDKDLECESPPPDVKAEDLEAKMCQPSCSYARDNPLKDEDYDSDEVADEYYTDSEEENKPK